MNLLIHDLTPEEWEREKDSYKGWAVISDTGDIRPCIGCFRCWTSGSGECVFRDSYNRIGAMIHEAGEMVIMSRYTYGGFSSFVKNAFDRCIGYVLPEFETAYGEMHHKKRYPEDKPVTFIFRGRELTEEEKEKARNYVAAVCRNLRGTVKGVVFRETGPEEDAETQGLEAAGTPGTQTDSPAVPAETPSSEPAGRSGILMINCSLRGEGSNSGVFLGRLREDLGGPADMVSLKAGADLQSIAEAFGKAETVVFGVPLYVDGLPSSALRLMEQIRRLGSGQGCRLYALVNNGLYESAQNINMLSMIKDFCAENGIEYRGALAIGAGEAVGMLMKDHKRSLWPARNAENGIRRLAEAVRRGTDAGENYADPFMFPRWMYILIANANWQRLKKAAKKDSQQR